MSDWKDKLARAAKADGERKATQQEQRLDDAAKLLDIVDHERRRPATPGKTLAGSLG